MVDEKKWEEVEDLAAFAGVLCPLPQERDAINEMVGRAMNRLFEIRAHLATPRYYDAPIPQEDPQDRLERHLATQKQGGAEEAADLQSVGEDTPDAD